VLQVVLRGLRARLLEDKRGRRLGTLERLHTIERISSTLEQNRAKHQHLPAGSSLIASSEARAS